MQNMVTCTQTYERCTELTILKDAVQPIENGRAHLTLLLLRSMTYFLCLDDKILDLPRKEPIDPFTKFLNQHLYLKLSLPLRCEWPPIELHAASWGPKYKPQWNQQQHVTTPYRLVYSVCYIRFIDNSNRLL